jgi:hypothetical protein
MGFFKKGQHDHGGPRGGATISFGMENTSLPYNICENGFCGLYLEISIKPIPL